MFPVSSFDKRLQITRNGTRDVISRSKVAVCNCCVESDSDSAQSSPSEPVFPRSPSQVQSHQLPGRKCSSFFCQRTGSSQTRGGSSTSVKREVNKNIRYVTFHQREAKLYNTELEEAERLGGLGKVQDRFDRSSQILEALALYMQSLDLKVRSFARLTDVTEDFAYKDLTPTESLPEALDRMTVDTDFLQRLKEVQSSLLEASKTPEQVYQLQEDFRESRKRQLSVSNRYSQYLRSSGSVTTNKLGKYEGRYEAIRADCEQNRKSLERELINLTDERHESLAQGFSHLVPILDKLRIQDNRFCTLCQEIAKCLRGPFKKQSSKNVCVSKQLLHRKT